MKEFVQLFSKYRKQLFVFILLGTVSQSLPGIFFPLVQKIFIDQIMVNKTSSLVNIIFFLLVYGLATMFLGTFFIHFSGKLQAKMVQDLRERIYDKVLTSKWADIMKTGSGHHVSMIINDSSVIINILQPIKEMIMNIFIIVVSIIICCVLNILNSICIGLIFLVIFYYFRINNIFTKQSADASAMHQTNLGQLTNKIIEDINGLREIQYYDQYINQKKGFKFSTEKVVYYFREIYKVYSRSSVLWNGFNTVITILIIVFVFLINNTDRLLLGNSIATIQYLVQIASVSIALGVYSVHVSSSIGVLKKVLIFLNQNDNNENFNYYETPTESKHDDLITLKNVSYIKNDKKIIDSLSLEIMKNAKIAFTGVNGSGKTTLLNMILGSIKPDTGEIHISSDQSKNKWKIIPVFQDTYVFSGSILENIALNDSIQEEKINQLAKILSFDLFINRLPNGLNTKIDGQGANLSGGEKQKIGLIRALIRKPEILLLDEATTWLDAKSEASLLDYLKSVNCTILCVSHKFDVLKKFDRIIILGRPGKILSDINLKTKSKELNQDQKVLELLVASLS